MSDNKIITLENLTEFKAKCDETYSGGTKFYLHTLVYKSSGHVLVQNLMTNFPYEMTQTTTSSGPGRVLISQTVESPYAEKVISVGNTYIICTQGWFGQGLPIYQITYDGQNTNLIQTSEELIDTVAEL